MTTHVETTKVIAIFPDENAEASDSKSKGFEGLTGRFFGVGGSGFSLAFHLAAWEKRGGGALSRSPSPLASRQVLRIQEFSLEPEH